MGGHEKANKKEKRDTSFQRLEKHGGAEDCDDDDGSEKCTYIMYIYSREEMKKSADDK